MKLIIFAGFLAACTAASLEHLEKKQNSYLPTAKNSSSSPSKDSDVEGSLGADTNAIGTSSIDQPGLGGRSFVPGSSEPNSSSGKDLSSSATDTEFSGYFYGPGIKNAYNQQSHLKAHNQFGTQTPIQQFDQQGRSKYPSQQNRNQKISAQGPSQQFGQQAHNQQFGQQGHSQQFNQQQQNQQFGQQAHSQLFGQQPHNAQFSPQTHSVTQQQPNQQFGQKAHSQHFGQQPLSQQPLSQQFGQQLQSQQYFQQAQNQQFGHVGSHVDQQDASSQNTNNFGPQARYQSRPSFANNQNQSFQNYPQQSFDDETGYHY